MGYKLHSWSVMTIGSAAVVMVAVVRECCDALRIVRPWNVHAGIDLEEVEWLERNLNMVHRHHWPVLGPGKLKCTA